MLVDGDSFCAFSSVWRLLFVARIISRQLDELWGVALAGVSLSVRSAPPDLQDSSNVTIDGRQFCCRATELETVCSLGEGAFGCVHRMRHVTTGCEMAVKVSTALANAALRYSRRVA